MRDFRTSPAESNGTANPVEWDTYAQPKPNETLEKLPMNGIKRLRAASTRLRSAIHRWSRLACLRKNMPAARNIAETAVAIMPCASA